MIGSRRSQADSRRLRCLSWPGGWLDGGCFAFGGAARGAVDVVAGAGGVMADPLGHELLTLHSLAVAFVVDLAGIALSDEVVALGEPRVGVLGGTAEHHQMVVARLGLGERPVILATETLLADPGVESRVALRGLAELRV